MSYVAKVLKLNHDVEEEVELEIEGITLTCFANVCPFDIKVGETYNVELTPFVANEYLVSEASEDELHALTKAPDSFAYEAVGKLVHSKIVMGTITLEDEILLREYSRFDGKVIKWTVDRIDVEFVSHQSR